MKNLRWVAAMLFVFVVMAPAGAHAARKVHSFQCDQCHKNGVSFFNLDNLCLQCHSTTPTGYSMYSEGVVVPEGKFNLIAASDAIGSNDYHPAGVGQTSHMWAGSDYAPKAGAQPATTYAKQFDGSYGISRGKVLCYRCHQPHGMQKFMGAQLDQNILKVPFDDDQACKDCHNPWDNSYADAYLTHPMVDNYYNVATANPDKFYNSVVNVGNGDVRLVYNSVTCTTCHGVHFTDSSSATVDDMAATYNAVGDGQILRTDGPLRVGASRDTAVTGTAQLRSNLCQACHKYKMHGKGGNQQMIGCLDCHGGHSYNDGNPNAFILATKSPDAVPVRLNRAPVLDPADVTYFDANLVFYNVAASTRLSWSDDTEGTAYGFCERCHGDVQDTTAGALGTIDAQHKEGGLNECDSCHVHSDPNFSFANDANAATCGKCHGFPPYKNIQGYRGAVGDAFDGGFANNMEDTPNADYYNSTSYFKDETKTAHPTHAGAALPTNPGEWYFVGTSGIANCKPCHGDDAGSVAGGHRQDPGPNPDTFRDVPFDPVATGNGALLSNYDVNAFTCTNVYCHTNGAPYDGASRPSRDYSEVHTTPKWVGDGTVLGGGYGSIFLQPDRCTHCHGNDVGTMGLGDKKNSPAHLPHLAAGFGCEVCHASVAASSTTLVAGATNGKIGGKHVNGSIEVMYTTSGSTLYNALAVNAVGVSYQASDGTCANYCHDPADVGASADWDSASAMQCDSCHGGLDTDTSADGGLGPITTGAHDRHVNAANGPQLGCTECHTNSGSGSDHVNGVVDYKLPLDGVSFANICEECHGFDAEPGEVEPVWYNSATTDCATCHAGTKTGANFNSHTTVKVQNSRTTGHNRPASAGNYTESGNVSADLDCLDCHIADSAGHWDGPNGNFMLRTDDNFPANYNAAKDAFCGNCHGTSPLSANVATLATRNINTHQSKLCIACHNVHGDQNVQMIWTTQADQLAHDPSATGKYAGDVSFNSLITFGDGSYDEDDGAVGGAGEDNADDICATCHTYAAGTTHTNADNTVKDHYQGTNCFTSCHVTHDNSTDAFKLGAGTACNDCHGYPPQTSGDYPVSSAVAGAHGDGSNLHARVSGYNALTEDRSDCAWCHTGADQYTYDLEADQSAGGARANHAQGITARLAVLANAVTSVGYNATNRTCSNACHASTIADGSWTDTAVEGNSGDGLDCTACHFYSGSPSVADVPSGLTVSHDEHFAKNKACDACHDTANPVSDYNLGVGHSGPLTHINSYDFGTGPDGNDGDALYNMATASQNEAGASATGVYRPGMTFSAGAADAAGSNNTCSGGIGLGCHASGTPDWDVAIPATNAGCLECHTNTDDGTFNPVSGIHGNNPTPTVTSNAHDGSFDDGNAGIADCITCHTASPTVTASDHIDGNFDASIDAVAAPQKITLVAGLGFTDGTTPTCAETLTGCHSAANTWLYKWTTDAYQNDNVRECNGCHGLYAGLANSKGWVTGTIHAISGYEARGEKHNGTGTSSYPCDDCHAVGAATYTFSPWKGGLHGDNKLQLNDHASTGWVINAGVDAGCGTSCHGQNATHNLPDPGKFSILYPSGNEVLMACSGCHGGTSAGGDILGYWPDNTAAVVDDTTEDNAGAHLPHVLAIAKQFLGQANLTELLSDSAGSIAPFNTWTANDKQLHLCSFCHGTLGGDPYGTLGDPLSDGTHGNLTDLPAEVNGMYQIWNGQADTGANYSAGSCSNVNCHNNKTTPATNEWYDPAGNGNCAMCHVDVNTDPAHTVHTGANTNFGIPVACSACHEGTTTTTDPPANNHIDGTFLVDQGTVMDGTTYQYTGYTYPSVKGTCGTNDCHEDGRGGQPKDNTYVWGSSLGDCTICHDASPTTGTHGLHIANYYVSGCDDCHNPATDSAHIGGTVTYNTTTISSAGGTTPNVTCSNACHGGATAEFDGAPGLACTDCHGGGFIGDGTNGPQFGMHVLTPTVTGKVHTAVGLSTTCDVCHDSMPAPGGTHVDGTVLPDGGATPNTDRGMFAGFTDGTIPTCVTSCHSAGTSWTYKWSDTVDNIDGSECANCHGDYANGWNAGVGHLVKPTRGNSSFHNATGSLTYQCTACHVIGSANGNYPWTTGSNDWAAEGTTLHGDGFIDINYNSTNPSRHENPVGTWRSGCAQCHDGASNDGIGSDDTNHDFPVNLTAPSSPRWTYNTTVGDPATSGGGGCDGCHGSTGYYAPDGTRNGGTAYPDRPGLHLQHMTALQAKGIAQNDACGYCHPDPGGEGHDSNSAPADQVDMPDNVTWKYKRIIGGGDDKNGFFNSSINACNNIDCHFNNTVTPHWYADNVKPGVATLTATQGPEPRSIKVTWLAPGDDGYTADTTPYVYDMRYSVNDGGAGAVNYCSTTNNVGGLPAAYKQGYNSAVIVENLTAGDTYYFSLRSRDTAGNWSDPSAVTTGKTPTVDTVFPFFGGADKAVKGDEGASVNLYWTAAEDHTMPIRYKIWMKPESAGPLDMNIDSAYVLYNTADDFFDTKIELEGLVNDTIYNFGVRACDPLGNCDDNTQVVSATPTDVPPVDVDNYTYRTNGSTTLVRGGAAGTAVTGATMPIVFAGANTTYNTVYFVDTFAVYLDTGNSPAKVRATLGKSTNGTNFTSLGITKDIDLGARADRVYQFKIVDVNGKEIGSGERIAIELTEITTPSLIGVKVNYGSTAYRGDMTAAEQYVNKPPAAVSLTNTTGIGTNDAIVEIKWLEVADGSDGITSDNTIHYDLYGSNNNGSSSYDYVIAEGLTGTGTAGTPMQYNWDTQTAGISSGTIAVKVNAGDGYAHTTTTKANLGTANANDYVAPSAITDLSAEKRPKAGTVWLTWTAPGDDYHNHGRADRYDIRYSKTPIGTRAIYNSIPSYNSCTGEPYPDFGGEVQNYEVTGLEPETLYYFAITTIDEANNVSPLSNVANQVGGPRCGMCHTTAPSVDESVGNHKLHGFTLHDCDHCHDDGINAPSSYGLDHQDGVLVMGYGPGKAHAPAFIDEASETIYYTNNGDAIGSGGDYKLYEDTDGWGGFGNGSYNTVGLGIDSGTCINFGNGLGGCHGPAGTDPDGGGPLPTYNTPTWNAAATLNCAACHGDPGRTTNAYGQHYDATVDNGMVVPDQIIGSPTVDNHGYYNSAAGLGVPEEQRKYIGQHEKHLNYSYRFSKKDSCNLCHPGKYKDKNDIDGRHANGEIEIQLDLNAAGPLAHYNSGTPTTAGTCFDMSPDNCHPSAAEPKWDTAQTFDCIQCHGMAGAIPTHVTDPTGGVSTNSVTMPGNCDHCHFPGHPRDDEGGTALILPNSSQVGITYRSGGIHLKKSIGGHASASTEAELCWNCHDQNNDGDLLDPGDISEWGTDAGGNNVSTRPTNSSDYDYGTLTQKSWVGATWSSPEPNFSYKQGAIQSTHSTNESNGTSVVTYNVTAERYEEDIDTLAAIRCSNCHDVHDLAKAPRDVAEGQPYLRGTWVRNPYPEDGAPWGKTYAITNADFTAVPRAGSKTAGVNNNEMGGYQIDQNNLFNGAGPTAGLSLATSAGICTLCHGTNIDTMDKTPSEDLWMTAGRNGHSNAAMGGTADITLTTNIFGNGIGGRAVPNSGSWNGALNATDIFDMALQCIPTGTGDPATQVYGYGYRTAKDNAGMNPVQASQSRSYDSYAWGATVDQTTLDVGYHAFTCSKCHNPHASRLPKLMITNCLDTGHNTWQTSSAAGETQTYWTSSTLDSGEYAATWNTAQNCHRYDAVDKVGGWNKVTPWKP